MVAILRKDFLEKSKTVFLREGKVTFPSFTVLSNSLKHTEIERTKLNGVHTKTKLVLHVIYAYTGKTNYRRFKYIPTYCLNRHVYKPIFKLNFKSTHISVLVIGILVF